MIFFTNGFDIFAVKLTGNKITWTCEIFASGYFGNYAIGCTISVVIVVYIMIEVDYSIKRGRVYGQMNRLLVKKEYIIVFVVVISSVHYHTVWVTAPKWITVKQSKARSVFVHPRKKSILINFVYSYHV